MKVINNENIPQEGGALITPNHMAYLDAVILVVTSSRPIRFLVHSNLFKVWWLKPLLNLSGAIPVASTNNPKEIIRSLKAASDALNNGEIVCIFPEGHLSRTGNMMKFNQGFERIMKNVDCPIIPVHLDRIWGSIFSFERGKFFFKVPKVIPYPVTISYGNPMHSKSNAFEVRNKVMELGADSFKYRLSDRFTLPEAFWKEARKHPMKFCIADSGGTKLTFGKALASSVALSDVFKKKLINKKNIGILIPPSCGGVLTNVAVSILNKVPINLNYTTSEESLISIIKQSEMEIVITSKKFIEKVGINIPGKTLLIEDVLSEVTFFNRLRAVLKAFAFPGILSHKLIFGSRKDRKMDNLATVMFTSGSTGEP
ncbi:Long-chain-fatty-acid--CoA ligase, partial [hydrothermal vent metagenome]